MEAYEADEVRSSITEQADHSEGDQLAVLGPESHDPVKTAARLVRYFGWVRRIVRGNNWNGLDECLLVSDVIIKRSRAILSKSVVSSWFVLRGTWCGR